MVGRALGAEHEGDRAPAEAVEDDEKVDAKDGVDAGVGEALAWNRRGHSRDYADAMKSELIVQSKT